MGDIADMMLDGTLCEGCGDFLGADNGHPVLCHLCAIRRQQDGHEVNMIPGIGWVDSGRKQTKVNKTPKKEVCPECGKKVRPGGLPQHTEAKHPSQAQEVEA